MAQNIDKNHIDHKNVSNPRNTCIQTDKYGFGKDNVQKFDNQEGKYENKEENTCLFDFTNQNQFPKEYNRWIETNQKGNLLKMLASSDARNRIVRKSFEQVKEAGRIIGFKQIKCADNVNAGVQPYQEPPAGDVAHFDNAAMPGQPGEPVDPNRKGIDVELESSSSSSSGSESEDVPRVSFRYNTIFNEEGYEDESVVISGPPNLTLYRAVVARCEWNDITRLALMGDVDVVRDGIVRRAQFSDYIETMHRTVVNSYPFRRNGVQYDSTDFD